jgi:mutator protein MutT
LSDSEAGPAPIDGRPIPVGIGLIRRGDHFLIRPRPPLPGSPMPGYWEFPGGKCHESEPPERCAARECREETGLSVLIDRLRKVVRYHYPHGFVELHFFDCRPEDPRAEPDPATGFRWVHVADLPRYTFPGANEIIVADLVRPPGNPAQAGTE